MSYREETLTVRDRHIRLLRAGTGQRSSISTIPFTIPGRACCTTPLRRTMSPLPGASGLCWFG